MDSAERDAVVTFMSGSEFDAALSQAERLLEARDRAVLWLRLVRFGLVVASVFSAVLLMVAAELLRYDPSALMVLVVLGSLAMTTLVLQHKLHSSAFRSLRERDERAMLEIVDLLRELLPDLERAERWSPARYRIVTARISRFPVGGRGAR